MKQNDECPSCDGTGIAEDFHADCCECGGSGRAPAADDETEALEAGLTAAEAEALAAGTHYLDAYGDVRPKCAQPFELPKAHRVSA